LSSWSPGGSAFGYLGPNGAGKTTLIRVLLGLTRADAGTMSLPGYRSRGIATRRSLVSVPSSTNPGSTAGHSRDRRGSPVPTAGMIATRVTKLRKRRGLMIALSVVNIGFPAVFLLIRLLAHAFAPHANPPAGGGMIFVVLVARFLPTFGFIVATTVGCTAGSRDLTEGMFRHLVVTGRSRLALYLARIPAGLAIVVPLVAIGYTIVCAVCVFAAPAFIDDSNVNIPPGLSRAGFENWAGDRAEPVICFLLYNGPVPGNVACPGPRE
jgi:energy-coupling factor transporter ATP-binding protein EcfA2